MKEIFDIDTATWSGTAFETSSSLIGLTKLNYDTDASATLYIDEGVSVYNVVDTTGNASTIFPVNINRGVRHSDTSSSQTGLFFEFTGSDSYVRVDAYSGIQKTSTFTVRSLLLIAESTEQVLMHSPNRYTLSYNSGFLYFRFTNIYNDVVTVLGPALTEDSLHAVGVSLASSGVHFGIDGTTTTVTSDTEGAPIDTYIMNDTNTPTYFGGYQDSSLGLVGLMGKMQYLTYAVDFSTWLVADLYSSTSPFFEIQLETPSTLTSDNAVAYALKVNDLLIDPHNLGFQISYDGGTTWFVPLNDAPWVAETGTLQASLENLNAFLGEYNGAVTDLRLKVFVNNNGTTTDAIESLALYYINDTKPFSLVPKTTVTFGTSTRFIDLFYSAAHVTWSDSTTLSVYVNSTASTSIDLGTYVYSGKSLTNLKTVIDGSWATRSDLIGTGSLSSSAVVLVTDGTTTITASTSVKACIVTIEDLTFTGGYGTPSVSVYNTTEVPNQVVIDSYSETSSGPVEVSLVPGSYKFVVVASNGDDYVQYRTITGDTTITLQATGSEDTASLLNTNVLDLEISDTTFAVGDTPTLSFRIKIKDSGLYKDLTGYSVFFAMRQAYGSSLQANRQCTITSNAYGKCSVQLSTSDTDTAGRFVAEVSIEKDGEVLTVIPHIYIDIVEGLR
jgi:hypothetical protein